MDLLTRYSAGRTERVLHLPDIELYCAAEKCKGRRFFKAATNSVFVERDEWNYNYVKYVCRNCNKTTKIFSVAAKAKDDSPTSFIGFIQKFGELPQYGPHTPSRLITLIGADRELFLKGRRAEINGLGIGAFAYYRRVVEHEKGRIIGEMAKVANLLGAQPETLQKFEDAAAESQFSKAIEMVKGAIPDGLLISGHNPLTLLHAALSEGLHSRDDSHCLDLAESIRLLLGELAERISLALKEDAELKTAVTRLLARKQENS